MKPPTSLLLVIAVTSNLPLTSCQGLCDYFKYRAPGSTQCVRCPSCPPGQEVTTHCGYTKYGQTRPACKPCTKGQTFSGENSLECQLCRVYCPEGMRVLKECTLTADTKCIKDCPPGSFVNSDGGCSKCSYCCGDNWQRSGSVQKACLNAGMGRCSCAPRKECKPPQGTCLQTTSTPPQTTTDAVLKLLTTVHKPTSSGFIKNKRNRKCKRRCRRKRKLGKKCVCNRKRKLRCKGKHKRQRKRKCKRKRTSRKRKRNGVSTPAPTPRVKQMQADVVVTRKRHRNRKVPLTAGRKIQKRSIDFLYD